MNLQPGPRDWFIICRQLNPCLALSEAVSGYKDGGTKEAHCRETEKWGRGMDRWGIPSVELKVWSRTLARRLGTYAQRRPAARIESTTGNAWLLPFSSSWDTGNWSGAECIWENGREGREASNGGKEDGQSWLEHHKHLKSDIQWASVTCFTCYVNKAFA